MQVKKILTYALFFAISAFLLYLTFKDTEFSTIKESIYSLNWGFIFLSFCFSMLSHFMRAWRWKLLLEPMGYNARLNTSFYAVIIGYLTNYAIPRGGELARCGVMFGTDKIPVDKLLGTVVTERIIDLLLLFVIFLLTLFIEFSTINTFLNFEQLWAQHHNFIYGLIGVGVASIILFFIYRKRVAQLAPVKKVLNFLQGFNAGLLSVFKIKNQPLFWLQSVGIWVGYFFINYTFMHAMHITEDLSWRVVLVVLAMGAVGFAIPTPGGAGSYHYIIKMTLVFYALSPANAEVYALVSHTGQAVFVALAGCVCIYLAFLERKKVSNEPPAVITE